MIHPPPPTLLSPNTAISQTQRFGQPETKPSFFEHKKTKAEDTKAEECTASAKFAYSYFRFPPDKVHLPL